MSGARRLDPHRRAVVERFKAVVAFHDMVGAGALGETGREPVRAERCGRDRRSARPRMRRRRSSCSLDAALGALAGRRQVPRSSTGRHQIATLVKKWKSSTPVRHRRSTRRATAGTADTIGRTFGEVAESGRTRLPAKEVTAARWSVGSNPTLSAIGRGFAHPARPTVARRDCPDDGLPAAFCRITASEARQATRLPRPALILGP